MQLWLKPDAVRPGARLADELRLDARSQPRARPLAHPPRARARPSSARPSRSRVLVAAGRERRRARHPPRALARKLLRRARRATHRPARRGAARLRPRTDGAGDRAGRRASRSARPRAACGSACARRAPTPRGRRVSRRAGRADDPRGRAPDRACRRGPCACGRRATASRSPSGCPSGHRRYSRATTSSGSARSSRDREAGMSMPAAIERAPRAAEPSPRTSIFAGCAAAGPTSLPYLLAKRTLIGLSHAIEDECAARAERPVLFGSFQRERFYRDAEPRWRELARTAETAIVFADFTEPRDAGAARRSSCRSTAADPLGREWSLICDAPQYAAFLSAWERPGQDDVPRPRAPLRDDLERRARSSSARPPGSRPGFVERIRARPARPDRGAPAPHAAAERRGAPARRRPDQPDGRLRRAAGTLSRLPAPHSS